MFGLFAHVYDIDDVIIAFCNYGEANNDEKIYYLNTNDGTINTTFNKADESNIYSITPLPNSFIEDLKLLQRLQQQDVLANEINNIITNCSCVGDIYKMFSQQTSATEWLREQVKASVVKWLDMNEILPPSMKHVISIDDNQPNINKCGIVIESH